MYKLYITLCIGQVCKSKHGVATNAEEVRLYLCKLTKCKERMIYFCGCIEDEDKRSKKLSCLSSSRLFNKRFGGNQRKKKDCKSGRRGN